MGIFKRLKNRNNDDVPERAGTQGNILASGDDLTTGLNGKGLDAIYSFLQDDYESRGYNDALVNPDESNKSDNLKLFHHDLMILIDRTSTYYETLLNEIDFHISSRSRAGLIDLVDELKIKKEIVNTHLAKIRQIKEETAGGGGAAQRIVLSYQRGFMRGLYAISQSKLFNGKIL